jgi:hypothetical protein
VSASADPVSITSGAQADGVWVAQSPAQAQTASGAIIQAEQIFQARAEAASQTDFAAQGVLYGVLVPFPSTATTNASASGRIVWGNVASESTDWADVPDEPTAEWTQLRA